MWLVAWPETVPQAPQTGSHVGDTRSCDVAAGGFLPTDGKFANGVLVCQEAVGEFDIEKEAAFAEVLMEVEPCICGEDFKTALGILDGEGEQEADEDAEEGSCDGSERFTIDGGVWGGGA